MLQSELFYRVVLKLYSVKWRGGQGVANYKRWAWQQSWCNSRYWKGIFLQTLRKHK